EVRRVLDQATESRRRTALLGLTAWATGELDAVDACAAALAGDGKSADAAVWSAGLLTLAWAARGDVRRAREHARAMRRAAMVTGSARLVRTTSVVEAEGLDAGWDAGGTWGCALQAAWARAPVRDREIRAWLEAAAAGDTTRRARARHAAARR